MDLVPYSCCSRGGRASKNGEARQVMDGDCKRVVGRDTPKIGLLIFTLSSVGSTEWEEREGKSEKNQWIELRADFVGILRAQNWECGSISCVRMGRTL